MIDKKAFRAAFNDFDKKVIQEVVFIYVNQHPERFREMEQSLEKRDFEKLGFVAHALKGVLAQLYAPEAREQARELEIKAKELAFVIKNNPEGILRHEQIMEINKMIKRLKKSSLMVMDDLKSIVSKL